MQPNSFKRLQMSSSKYFYHGLLVVWTQGPIEVCPSPSFLCACMHTYAMQQSPTSPDIKMHAYHSHDEDHVQVCVLLYTHSACTMYLSFLKAEDEVYVSHTCQFYEWQHCGVEEVTTADLHSSGWRGPSTWRIHTKCSSMGLLVIMVQLILNPTFNKLMVFDRHIDTSSYL